MKEYLIKPIGVVRSMYREPSLTVQDQDLKLNRETLIRTKTNKMGVSELIIKKEFEDCLDGIEDFSHIVVLYWAHLIAGEKRDVTKVHPAGKKEYPLVGVFATRSPARPNPICSTTVQLLERNGNVLKVKGLDALDGSPIIDIKFHHPSYDAPPNVKIPDWVKKLLNYFREELK
jgi:tRNA-Thr(GGU) m(6)t(6)A37 methyltransferase TsaA